MEWEELTTFGECSECLHYHLDQVELLREPLEGLHQVAGDNTGQGDSPYSRCRAAEVTVLYCTLGAML